MNGIHQTPEGIWVLDEDSHLSKWVAENKRLDCDMSANFAATAYLNPDDVCVDVGANIGDHTWAYLQAVGPGGKVYAFEPHRLAFECLKRNCPAANCYPIALGKMPGIKTVKPDHDSPLNVGMAWIDPFQVEHPSEPGDVMVQPLDNYSLGRLNWLKIDVEGMEPEVIAGATQTIVRCRPFIYIELNQHTLARRDYSVAKLVELIQGLNYQLKFLSDGHGFHLSQVDVLFVPYPA